MVRLSVSETRVTFVVNGRAGPGERICLVGSDASLGGWDPRRAVELTTSEGDCPRWRVSLTLPANREIAYKYALVGARDAPAAATAAAEESADPTAGESSSGLDEIAPGAAVARSVKAWEPFEELRVLETLPGKVMVVNDGMFGTLNNGDPNRVQTTSLVNSRPSKEKELDSDVRSDGGRSPMSLAADAEESVIIVLYRLPIIAEKSAKGWHFHWDDDALYLTSTGLRRGLEELNYKPLWVGILNTDLEIEPSERDEVAAKLLGEFNCVPVFLPKSTLTKFYQGFCKGFLWPSLHTVPILYGSDARTKRFDEDCWHAYQRVNRTFSKAVIENYERHLIWVHDYHLMLLPYYLRIKLSGVKIGFYLHIPWPSSEIFRMLPVRTEILKGLLSATLLGFHLFDYARHFLSACVRLLNLEHEARRGCLGIDYEGRHVMIRVSHIGVDPQRFIERLGMPDLRLKAAELEARYPAKTLLGAIDDLDVIKGIALKLIAFENYLASSSERVRSNVALIQVAIPKAARVDRVVRDEIRELVNHINTQYGTQDHKPVMYIEQNISFDERMAIYSVCDALLLTPIRDGLNLIPYEYIVSTPQGKGQLILSEFTGCSRALSSAVRVNPWNVNELRDVIDNVIQKRESRAAEIRLRHEADRKYVTMHSSATWAESFLGDLKEASEAVREVVRLGLNAGLGFRRLEFEEFTMLNTSMVVRAFRESKDRLFLFDYDGTLTQNESQSSRMAHAWAKPSEDVMRNLEALSKEPHTTVVILSGRSKDTDGFQLPPMRSLGIAAEHGFFYKSPGSDEWEMLQPEVDLSWIEVAQRIMQLYTERTDGSYIEEKLAGIVWHYHDADPEFGAWQAKEMHDHLESILSSFSVQVVNGLGWLQVRLAFTNKGNMVSRMLHEMPEAPDFVLCCGDDRTDEDMFDVLSKDPATMDAKLFTTTVGVKPSNARYYLRNSLEVAQLIEQIIEVAFPGGTGYVRSSTLEDMRSLAARVGGAASGILNTSNSSSALDARGHPQ